MTSDHEAEHRPRAALNGVAACDVVNNEPLHAFQHLTLVLTALVFWWGMTHGRYGAIGYGVAVVYVFLTALHSGLLGALMTLAPAVWYSPYAAASRRFRVDALADQQIAGLIVWIPTGVIFIAFGLSLLAAWLRESERRARRGSVGSAHKAGLPFANSR